MYILHLVLKINRQIRTTVRQLLVMVKSILYEGTIAFGTGLDFGKCKQCKHCHATLRNAIVPSYNIVLTIANTEMKVVDADC